MRIACLDLPAFPLQLVWRQEPTWRAHPVVVIESDRPQGEVLWACERARALGVLAGQRYAQALVLCSGLRARVVPSAQIAEAIAELVAVLHQLSPRVEPGEPGTFWLDGEGLGSVFPESAGPEAWQAAGPALRKPTRTGAGTAAGLGTGTAAGPGDGTAAGAEGEAEASQRGRVGRAWGQAIAQALSELGYRAAIVVGSSRFASYAIARGMQPGMVAFEGDADERAAASAVALARLDIEPRLRDALGRLGVRTVGEMVRLPGGGILERFGRDAHRLYQLAAGEAWDPLVAMAPPEAIDERIWLDDDEDDLERLVFASKAPIDRLIERLAARGRALTALHLELSLKHAVGQISVRADCIKPAAATLDSRSLLRLVHLRLTGMPPAAPVNAVRVWAEDIAATRDQLALFAAKPRRDLRAANEAVAQLRAELGEDAVVRAVLREGHLPEASFGWDRLDQVMPAAVAAEPALRPGPLIRRVFARPQQLPAQPRLARDDGWLLSGLELGAVVRIQGPYIVSGGWWSHETVREYHFAELHRGHCLWVYYDRHRRHWFWHGSVE
jgi:protein ImuB